MIHKFGIGGHLNFAGCEEAGSAVRLDGLAQELALP